MIRPARMLLVIEEWAALDSLSEYATHLHRQVWTDSVTPSVLPQAGILVKAYERHVGVAYLASAPAPRSRPRA